MPLPGAARAEAAIPAVGGAAPGAAGAPGEAVGGGDAGLVGALGHQLGRVFIYLYIIIINYLSTNIIIYLPTNIIIHSPTKIIIYFNKANKCDTLIIGLVGALRHQLGRKDLLYKYLL